MIPVFKRYNVFHIVGRTRNKVRRGWEVVEVGATGGKTYWENAMKHEYNKSFAGAGGTKAWIKCLMLLWPKIVSFGNH